MRLIAINAADDATVTQFETTNLVDSPNAFDSADWTTTQATVSANPTPPVGTPAYITGADKLVEDTNTGAHYIRQVLAGSQPIGRYTVAVSIAPGGRTNCRLAVHDHASTGNNAQADIDLTAGTVVTTTNGSGVSILRASVGSNGGGGWRRCVMTFYLAAPTTVQLRISLLNSGGASSFAGNGSSGVFLNRAQLEPAPINSAYITGNNGRFLGSLPAANVQREGRGLVARTNGAAAGSFGWQGNWAALRTVRAAVLYRHNLGDTASIRLVLFDDVNTAGNIVYDSGGDEAVAGSLWSGFSWVDQALAPKFSAIYLAAAVQARSFLLLVSTDAGNPDGYSQAKRLIIGDYIEPAANLQLGLGVHWVDNSTQTRTQAGSLRSDPQAKFRRLSGRQRLTDAERDTWMQASGYAGTQREVFASVYPGLGGAKERDHSLLGKFTEVSELETDQPLAHLARVEIQEV